MTSTFLNYRVYSNNLTQSLQRVAAEPSNATDQKYYEANIGKVKSVDDFLNNYRLFTYAMKAYGLQDLGNAKALMRQVLTSDLSNSNSVANRLNDSRYKAFAAAFNFTTTGAIAGTGVLQTNSQQQDMLGKMGVSASAATAIQASLSKVTSVQSLLANSGLYDQVLTAYGLDPTKTSKADVTRALESNLSDRTSFVNRPDFTTTSHNSDGTTTTTTNTNYAKFRALAEDFNFATDGTIGGQKLLQSPQNIAATQTAYMSRIPSNATSQAAAQDESDYYAKTMPQMTSVDRVLSDTRLVNVMKTAFALPATMTNSQLRELLTSNLLDAKSAANTYGIDPKAPPATPTNAQLLASAFNIGADGMPFDHSLVQTTPNLTATTSAYTKAAAAGVGTTEQTKVDAAAKAAQVETDYFTSVAPTLKSVTALLADSRLVAYIRTAYNLPVQSGGTATTPATGFSTTDIGNILKSDLLDPHSVANTAGGSARTLAAAFNFAPNGLVYNQRSIQNAANISATTTAYQRQAGTGSGAKAASQVETDYYTATLPRLKSVDDMLSDKRLVAYVSKAYNIPVTQPSVLRQVLTSNLLDPKSKANTLGGGYQTLASAFDISPDGTITPAADRQAQSKTGIAAIHTAYLDQMMESEAGDNQGDGVRLALYFKRVAPTITSAYGILADKALTSVVQTMLGLSSSSSKADIDSQARYIGSKINIADFKDPAKLEKMVSRFAALYDLTSGTNDSSSWVSTLF